MKRLVLGVAVLGLSACGWNNSGHHGYNYGNQYSYNSGYYNGHQGHQQQQPVFHGQHMQRRTGKTSLEFSAGIEEFTGGNIVPQIALGNNNQINKIEYKDAFDTALRVSGGIAHDVAPKTTLLARGFYKQADGSDDQLAFAQNGAGTPTAFGSFSDYKSYGAEVGFREYLNDYRSRSKLRPYIGATVGAAYAESVDLNIANNQGNTAVQILDGEWIPTASALVGLEMPVSNQFSLGLESGLRYEGKRDIGPGAFESTDAYSVPVQLRGRFRF